MNALIIPVYKSEELITELLEALESLYLKLDKNLFVTFVVDGSPDRCHDILKATLSSCDFPSQLILHSRNFGAFAAIRTGLENTAVDHYAVMAADLQEPPDLILRIFHMLEGDRADLILAARDSRKDPLSTKILSNLFWNFYRKYIIKEIPKGGVDIFGCNRRVRDRLLQFNEAHSSLIAQLMWVGYRRETVTYHRLPRQKGKSSWSFHKKIDYLLDSVFAFTDLPIKILIGSGFLGLTFSFVYGVVVFISRLLGKIPVSGFTALMVVIIFFGALNLLGLGIIGSYAQRAYENTKQRPLAIVSDIHISKRAL